MTQERSQPTPTEEDTVKLEDRVVAVISSVDAGEAATALGSQGFGVEVLRSEADVERLEPKQGGLAGALSKAAALFGDEMRIIDQIERTLSEGNQVLVVTAGDRADQAVRLLEEHGALATWDFGTWTWVKVTTTDREEDETG